MQRKMENDNPVYTFYYSVGNGHLYRDIFRIHPDSYYQKRAHYEYFLFNRFGFLRKNYNEDVLNEGVEKRVGLDLNQEEIEWLQKK